MSQGQVEWKYIDDIDEDTKQYIMHTSNSLNTVKGLVAHECRFQFHGYKRDDKDNNTEIHYMFDKEFLDTIAVPDEYLLDSHNWDGDLHAQYRASEEWFDRRDKAFERDGYKCRLCGCGHHRLNVHHIQDWRPIKSDHNVWVNKWAYDDKGIDGLVCLCPMCHRYLAHKEHLEPLQSIVEHMLHNDPNYKTVDEMYKEFLDARNSKE